MPDSSTVFRPGRDAGPHAAAVVFATMPAAALTIADATPADPPDGTLLGRLAAQLGTLPVARLHVITREPAPRPGPAAAPPAAAPAGAPAGTVTGVGTGTATFAAVGRGTRLRPRVTASPDLAGDLRQVAAVARAGPGPVIVLAGDLVAHTEALARLADSPGTAALVGPAAGAGPLRVPVRVEDGAVAAAGNAFHEVTAANATFGGAFVAGPEDLAGLADVAEELAALVEAGRLGPVPAAQAAELLLTGLVRTGVPVRAAGLGPLRARRAADRATAEAELAALAGVDEDAARLDAAIKKDDGVFTTYAVTSWSAHLVRAAARAGLTPNAVTGISAGFAAIAAVWFSAGDRIGLLAGAVAFYLSFVFDCVDGGLARYTRARSALGAWLDTVCDRGKEFGVYAALAAGYPGDAWPLAIGAMLLLALRHAIGSAYAGAAAGAGRTGGIRSARSLTLPYDTGAGDEPGAAPSPRGEPRLVWARRMVVLPIGERTALICVTAALFDARVTFLALLGWGGVATLYMLAGRVARSLRRAEA